jgi:Tfp pilus assembly protein PilX
MLHRNAVSTKGFALLMSLLIISVVIPVIITLLDISSKQLRLAGTAQDSEIAFGAASAGVECAQYMRRLRFTEMENVTTPTPVTFSCFGVTSAPVNPVVLAGVTNGDINHYQTRLSWSSTGGSTMNRCSELDVLVMVSSLTAPAEVDAADIRAILPNYPTDPAVRTCPPGGLCTIVASRGYNRVCPASLGTPFPIGTIQREILLEY